MAVCYQCNNVFYGFRCFNCGWKVQYKCWNCGYHINPELSNMCNTCKWFFCESCAECGCSSQRPKSKMEKLEE